MGVISNIPVVSGLLDPGRGYRDAQKTAAQTSLAAAQMAELQNQRQLAGMSRALGALSPAQNVYNAIYGLGPTMQGPANPMANGGAGTLGTVSNTPSLNSMVGGGGYNDPDWNTVMRPMDWSPYFSAAQGGGGPGRGQSALNGAAGGALAGFSVGGPWGAAIGGGLGLLGGLGF
jgi:hypothetical protein